MNIVKSLKKDSGRPWSSLAHARDVLPELHAFVEIALGEDRERRSISIDGIDSNILTTRAIPGLRVGEQADFLYRNAHGRYRFLTVCAAFDAQHAYFEMPLTVKTLTDYGSKRGAVRIASTLPIHWRYAAGGGGNGDFLRGSISDLSCGGALLIVDRDVKVGAQVEVRLALRASAPPLLVLCEVIRVVKIATSVKTSAGIRFVNLDGNSERALNVFIHERQTLRRERGVV